MLTNYILCICNFQRNVSMISKFKTQKLDFSGRSLPIGVELLATIDGICIVCGPVADEAVTTCCRCRNKCCLRSYSTRSRLTSVSNYQKLSIANCCNNLGFPLFLYSSYHCLKINYNSFFSPEIRSCMITITRTSIL